MSKCSAEPDVGSGLTEPRREKPCFRGFPTRSDTDRAVQQQRLAQHRLEITDL